MINEAATSSKARAVCPAGNSLIWMFLGFSTISSLVAKVRAGYFLGEASTLKQVKNSKTPILFIHGDEDDFVPYYMMDKLYNATSSEKEMLTIKNAGHAKASEVDPEIYWTTVSNFTSKYITQ